MEERGNKGIKGRERSYLNPKCWMIGLNRLIIDQAQRSVNFTQKLKKVEHKPCLHYTN